MNDRQILIVRNTWRLLRGINPQLLGDVFYKRLFFTYPAVRSMFKQSMQEQYERFVEMLSVIIAYIDRPEMLTDELKQLAKRHEGYGVKVAHYQPVGEALLWTLEQGLGKHWNEEVRLAWLACYQALVEAMLPKQA